MEQIQELIWAKVSTYIKMSTQIKVALRGRNEPKKFGSSEFEPRLNELDRVEPLLSRAVSSQNPNRANTSRANEPILDIELKQAEPK